MRFKSEPTLETQSRSGTTSEPGRARSVVGVDLKVVGDMNCTGEIQVDGTVQGDINSKTVKVGEGGCTDGLISADTINIRGTVKGETRAACVVVAGTARVEGDIKYQSLSIEAGAYLDGYCRPRKAEKVRGEHEISTTKPARLDAPEKPQAVIKTADFKDTKY